MPIPYEPAVLRKLIQDTLTPHGLYTRDVEELLMFTCANESDLGTYRTQAPHGPARGIFQCEGATFNDIFANYLRWHWALNQQVTSCFTHQPPMVDELVTNDIAAIMICRIQYLRAPEAIPAYTDIEGIWALYKLRYNTPIGAATHDIAMAAYKKYVLLQ